MRFWRRFRMERLNNSKRFARIKERYSSREPPLRTFLLLTGTSRAPTTTTLEMSPCPATFKCSILIISLQRERRALLSSKSALNRLRPICLTKVSRLATTYRISNRIANLKTSVSDSLEATRLWTMPLIKRKHTRWGIFSMLKSRGTIRICSSRWCGQISNKLWTSLNLSRTLKIWNKA